MTTSTSDDLAQHRLPREQWPAFAGRRPDLEVAGRPDLELPEQERLSRSHRRSVRARLALNPSIDARVQRVLAGDVPDVVRGLAQNPGLCPAVRSVLLARGDRFLTRGIARGSVLEPHLLDVLAGTQGLRRELARNRNLPPQAYHRLRQDDDEDVRVRLAINPALPEALQARLARDPVPRVRAALARNTRLTPAVQAQLARDTAAVLALAENRALVPEVVDALLASPAAVSQGLAHHPRLDLRQQLQLERDRTPDVRRALAANPCLHPGLQERLSTDPLGAIRAALARNPSLVPQVQVRLAADHVRGVRAAILQHPALDRSALRVLLDARIAGDGIWLPDERPRIAALGLATHWTPASLDHPGLGPLVALLTGKPSVLDAAAEHPDALVRCALLANERIGGQRLGVLLADPHEGVRTRARHCLVGRLAG